MNKERLTAAGPLLIFGLLVLVLIVGLRHNRAGDVSKFAQHIGDPVPVTDLPVLGGAGGRFTTASWQGKPYIINFFASWCADCKAEHEELMTLGVAHMPLIGITFKDKSDKAALYLERVGNPFLAVAEDEDGRAGIDWGLTGVPETFVIDARGIIRWHHIGGLTDQIVSDELMPLWESVSRDGS